MAARKRVSPAYADGKMVVVGQFFELLAARVFRAVTFETHEIDLCLWDLRVGIEVKSTYRQNTYGFRLDIDQLQRIVDLAIFPLDSALYLFFAYSNARARGEELGTTELARCIGPAAIREHLAANILWGCLVDLKIVQAWRNRLPISSTSILHAPGEPAPKSVNIKPKRLYELQNGGCKSSLIELGLRPSGFRTLRMPIETTVRPNLFEAYPVRFPLTAVLSHSVAGRLGGFFEGHGVPISEAAS